MYNYSVDKANLIRITFDNKFQQMFFNWQFRLPDSWASAPIGKTRHLPGPGIWHLWNFRYNIANFNENLGMKSAQVAFFPVQNIICPPQKTVLRTPMTRLTSSVLHKWFGDNYNATANVCPDRISLFLNMIVFTEKRAAEYTDRKVNESEAKSKWKC